MYRINKLRALLFFAMLLYLTMHSKMYGQESSRPNVLILHSYHQQFKWTEDITKGIEDVLSNKCNLQVQYMDTKRQFDEEYKKILFDLIYHKHIKHNYRVIISSDNNALTFLKKYHDTIFGKTPIVFCGVNYAKPEDFEHIDNITGVSEDVDIEKNFELIRKLQPNAENLYVIVDETPTGIRVKQKVNEIVRKRSNLFKLLEVTDRISMSELEDKLGTLTSKDAVLFTLFFRDKNDNYYSYGESARRIAGSSTVPVFSLWDFYMDFGIVGGYMADGYAQGAEAAKLALQILEGKNANELPIVWKSPNNYKFDYNILLKYGIDPDLLPSNAKLINEPYSLYKHDRKLFYELLIIISLLSLLSVLLIISAILRRRLTIKIRNKNNYLRTILNAVGEGIIDVAPDNRVRAMNPVAEIITGYTEVDAIGKSLDEVYPVKKSSKIPGKESHYYFTNNQGKSYKVSHTQNKLKDKGKDYGMVIAFSDITNIIESEERFSRITENARDVIYRLSIPDGKFEYVSSASKEILGYSPEELYQRPLLFKNFIPADWQRFVFEKWIGARKGHVDKILEFQIIDKLEKRKWINQRSVLIYDNEGKPIAMEGIMTDITDQKNIEIKLRESLVALEEAKEKAEESDKLKSAFLANIAHEIRTPMNGIMGFSQLLRSADLSDVSHEKYLNIIHQSSERMLNIIDDLVNIAQIESGQTRTKIKEVRLDVFIKHINDQFESKAENKNIALIQKDVEALKGKVIKTDHYKLDYAIRKLISNAIKFTHKGTVTYCMKLESGKLSFKVKDTGIGISEENKKKIFERFVQADNNPFKAEEGAGLGLAIANSFVEILGGKISLESELGAGSVFSFSIPVELV
ncbi:MAG: hypothetical protein C0599_18090 [Salinivirgaceae bacterium]|nr:MAG: hypothetical protein C0599_18090 [Salinivirgaceae bacterium]